MNYSIHSNQNNLLPEWEVFNNSEWLASFSRKSDAELFVKIKQINDILST